MNLHASAGNGEKKETKNERAWWRGIAKKKGEKKKKLHNEKQKAVHFAEYPGGSVAKLHAAALFPRP